MILPFNLNPPPLYSCIPKNRLTTATRTLIVEQTAGSRRQRLKIVMDAMTINQAKSITLHIVKIAPQSIILSDDDQEV